MFDIKFDNNVKALDVKDVNLQDFDQIKQIRFDELFVAIYENLKTDLKFACSISSMTASECLFAYLAQAQESAVLLELMLKKFKRYPVEKYATLEDVIYHFLLLTIINEVSYRPSIFFVRNNENVEYLVISKIRSLSIENELRNILKTLFKLNLIIFPFHTPVELIFTESRSVYHSHEYSPKYILFDYHTISDRRVFKLFIDYLFLYTVLKQITRQFSFSDVHFMNFFDIYIKSGISYEFSQKVLVDLSTVYPLMRFFLKDGNDKFFLYHNKQMIRLPSYLFPKIPISEGL